MTDTKIIIDMPLGFDKIVDGEDFATFSMKVNKEVIGALSNALMLVSESYDREIRIPKPVIDKLAIEQEPIDFNKLAVEQAEHDRVIAHNPVIVIDPADVIPPADIYDNNPLNSTDENL